MLLRLSIQRVARGIGRALGQLQLEITFDGVQSQFHLQLFASCNLFIAGAVVFSLIAFLLLYRIRLRQIGWEGE